MSYYFSPYYEVALVLALVLLVLAAPSQFTARNTGTILYICWVFLGNLITLINKLVWNDHARNVAPVWCDITVYFRVGFHFAIEAACIVINRRLFMVSRFPPVITTAGQRRKELIIELSIGLGIPVVGMCLQYVVQGHRANIIQGVGCWTAVYNTTLSFPLVWIWPCVFSLIAGTYGILYLRAFLKHRGALEEFLNSHISGLTADRYLRLMCFSVVQVIIAFPLSLFVVLSQALNFTVHPWISWENTHSNFDRIDPIPASIALGDNTNLGFSILLWAVPFLSYLFFLFFGLGRERTNQYKRWLCFLLKPFGINPPTPEPCSTDHQPWWQKLLAPPASASASTTTASTTTASTATNHSAGLTSSRDPTDLLPIFRRDADAPHNISYPKPIPTAHSRLPHTAPFDASFAGRHIKALPAGPSFVLETNRPGQIQRAGLTCQIRHVGHEAGAAFIAER